MFSTKFWFTLVSITAAAAVAALLLARNSYNLAREEDVHRILRKDCGEAWALLKSDARVRVDEVVRVAADREIVRVLSKAKTAPDTLTPDDRAAIGTALVQQNKNLEALGADLLIALDANGVAMAHVWAEGPSKVGYSLAGFPAVEGALRGFMQDDVWTLALDPSSPDRVKAYRVATRPIIGLGQYVGAVVHGQSLDSEFAGTLAKRLGAQVVFFRGPVVIASALPPAPEGAEPVAAASDQVVAGPLDQLLSDARFLQTGRSEVTDLEGFAAIYSLVTGSAALVTGGNVGYAIVRPVPHMATSIEFMTNASQEDWKELAMSTPGMVLGGSLLAVLILGFLFFSLEHGRPLRKLRKSVDRLAAREVDRLNIYAVSRKHRKVAEAINTAIDKTVQDVAEKLGKRPAEIDQILGPRDGSERVSSALFTFPEERADEIPPPPPAPAGAQAPPPPRPAPPVAPPAPMQQQMISAPQPFAPAASPQPQPAPPGMGRPFQPAAHPQPMGAPMPPQPGPQATQPPLMTMPAQPHPVAQAQAGMVTTAGYPAPAAAPGAYQPTGLDDDKTQVADVPEALLEAASRDEVPGQVDEEAYFHEVFDEFLATKRRCGEPTDTLQYERFVVTLRRNRDALIERYGCRTVRFQVYVKDGKAALKATPVRS